MRKRLLTSLLLASLPLGVSVACGGSSASHRVEEVPINDSIKRPTDLPPDEVGADGSISTPSSSSALPEHGPPPGVGPQPLDTGDAGAASSTSSDAGPTNIAAFASHPGGLSEKECNDLVMKYAKLVTKETKAAAPSATELPQHAVYGPMFSDCGKSATKKQQKCAAAARTSAAWKKCME